MSEDAYYTARLLGPVTPQRLFRQPGAVQEGMVIRLAKAIITGGATHRVSANSHTGEKTWLLRDVSPAEWWMIDTSIEAASRALLAAATDAVQGRGDMTPAAILAVLETWEVNDQWTVIVARDPAARMGNPKTTARQLEKSLAYSARHETK